MTQLELTPETTMETTEPILTHIIDRGDDTRTALDIVFEARINGTPLTTLCGHVFVPERDPMKHPLCDKCVEIYEFAKDFRSK